MGSKGDKPRKTKQAMPKVPRYEEPNSLHVAGLSEDAGGPFGSRLGHSTAHARSQDLSRFQRSVLRLLGRRTKSATGDRPDESATPE